MSNVLQWTPIQEGRFHQRAMKKGETIKQYVTRAYAEEERRDALKRIGPLIVMARDEVRKFKNKKSQR